eukprot:6211851-Prymnesium_polylepis.1
MWWHTCRTWACTLRTGLLGDGRAADQTSGAGKRKVTVEGPVLQLRHIAARHNEPPATAREDVSQVTVGKPARCLFFPALPPAAWEAVQSTVLTTLYVETERARARHTFPAVRAVCSGAMQRPVAKQQRVQRQSGIAAVDAECPAAFIGVVVLEDAGMDGDRARDEAHSTATSRAVAQQPARRHLHGPAKYSDGTRSVVRKEGVVKKGAAVVDMNRCTRFGGLACEMTATVQCGSADRRAVGELQLAAVHQELAGEMEPGEMHGRRTLVECEQRRVRIVLLQLRGRAGSFQRE